MIGGGAQKITVEIGGKIAASLGASLRTAQMQVSSFGRNVNRTMNDAALAGRKGFKGMFDNALWQQAAVGAAGIGVALGASIRQAASFELILSDIGKTANIGQSELKGLSGELLRLSGRNLTNLSPEKLAAGIQDLVAQGLELKDAVASMESLGKVATATNSDLLDVTKTGFQLQNALKIRPTELKATFDALAFAGKQGAFELRDMAQFMPTIAAAAGSLGIQGQKGAVSLAAMMQMVRKDAPDAGQAATRLTDAMLKLTAPDAVKRFSKFGVNIEQVLNDAKAKGINPMEAALDQLQKVTGGDVFKLSQIFGDKEAKLALMSLMKYRKEYEQLKAEAGGAAAAGTVDKDFQRSLATFQGTLTSFQNSAQRLGIAVGNALLPPLTRMAEIITPIAEGIGNWAAANPGLMTGVTVIAAGLAGLVVALPVIAGVVSAIGTIGTAIGALTAAFPVLAGIGTVLAVAAGPITLVVAGIIGIGAAFTFAYHKVEWFRTGVNAMVAGISATFTSFISVLQGGWTMLVGVFTGDTKKIQAGFGQMIAGVQGMFTSWYGWMTSLFQRLVSQLIQGFARFGPGILGVIGGVPMMIISLFNRAGIGQRIITSIIDGLKARAGALFSWIGGAVSRIGSMVGGGGDGGGGGQSSAGGGRAATPPGRAIGGLVRAGFPYIVGERRRELFVPGMDGAIIPRIAQPLTAGALAALMSAQPAAAQAVAPFAPALNLSPQLAAPAQPPVNIQAPARAPALPARPAITINAPITIHAGGGDAMEIRRQVDDALQDLVRQMESAYRTLLND
jgi:TP901 family phage tail tape measure protein